VLAYSSSNQFSKALRLLYSFNPNAHGLYLCIAGKDDYIQELEFAVQDLKERINSVDAYIASVEPQVKLN